MSAGEREELTAMNSGKNDVCRASNTGLSSRLLLKAAAAAGSASLLAAGDRTTPFGASSVAAQYIVHA
jgi:hypothetical protein